MSFTESPQTPDVGLPSRTPRLCVCRCGWSKTRGDACHAVLSVESSGIVCVTVRGKLWQLRLVSGHMVPAVIGAGVQGA